MEIKSVPLADYEDVDVKERKKLDFSDRKFNTKIAYFPDGYRKKTTDVISERALKHVKELTLLKKERNIRTILCFVIQRSDVKYFTASKIDPIYKEAFNTAIKEGVEIVTMVVKWNKEGEAKLVKLDLEII